MDDKFSLPIVLSKMTGVPWGWGKDELRKR
jgi:hypothetical protein